MIIYHGATEVIETPKIISVNRGRDFGAGFYMTTIKKQAEKWAVRQMRNRNAENAVLNAYEYDVLHADKQLNIKTFVDYSVEWLDLIISCRKDRFYKHDYDIVSGKIANDDVGETVQAVVDGLSSKEFALSKLIFMLANDQLCFCTDKSLSFLTFVGSERIIYARDN